MKPTLVFIFLIGIFICATAIPEPRDHILDKIAVDVEKDAGGVKLVNGENNKDSLTDPLQLRPKRDAYPSRSSSLRRKGVKHCKRATKQSAPKGRRLKPTHPTKLNRRKGHKH